MNIRTFSLILILAYVLLAAFASLNWVPMAEPSSLNLGFVEVTAPLGLIMLAFTAAISGLFVVYIVLLQAGIILEERRLTKELNAQRELADTAETSRYTELRALMEDELHAIETQSAETSLEFGNRLGQTERSMQQSLTEATGTLSAYLGEIEDKLDRVLAPGYASGKLPQTER